MTEACEVCAQPLSQTPFGPLCGACTISSSLVSAQTVIGEYERLQKLGEGGAGMVYMARHLGSGELVAIKLANPSLLAYRQGRALFLRQAKIESALRHPNVVHVQGVGVHEGTPFVVMPLMERGTLADPDNLAHHGSLEARLALVLKIARAVQFAHQHGVLHCDLKPENILFDATFEPQVSDFGMARTLGETGEAADEGLQGGTRGWMSPEQTSQGTLTTASDVFALGVMLYWLVTGELPFGADEDFERRVQHEPPPPRPRWSPDLRWCLLAVAHKALQREPRARYPSAAAFANDLERAQQRRPILACSLPIGAPLWYWTLRHAAARNAVFLLLLCFALLASLVARSQREELARAVLAMNAYAAGGQAAAVLYQLREYADAIEGAAQDPRVRTLTSGPRRVRAQAAAKAGDPCSVQTALEDPEPLRAHGQRFSTITVFDSDGCARARISEEPPSPDYAQRSFDWRDYFRGARLGHAATPHVRMAYRSSVSQLIKFAVSAPLFEQTNRIGVVAGSITAASTLDLPRTQRFHRGDQLTVLLGPFEGEVHHIRHDSAEFTFLAHPKLARGQKVTLDSRLASALKTSFRTPPETPQFQLPTATALERSDYVDPLLGGRWLAAFAPVGATGYVVLVQTRASSAERPNLLLQRAALALTLACALALLGWGALFLWSRSEPT